MIQKCENCGKCCIETEMLLSQQDIDSIIKNTANIFTKEQFAFTNNEGFFQLKNNEGYCFFFDRFSKICKIYEYRPQGCRFYPLIYDFQKQKCVLDKDCPRKELFYHNIKDNTSNCKELKNFLKKRLKIKLS
ncbi:MAG: YkgJ family cysteine cluster protein [Promethearchaeota archaeon]